MEDRDDHSIVGCLALECRAGAALASAAEGDVNDC